MYDLKKIVIVGTWDLKDKECLQTIALKTNGLKTESLLFISDIGICPTKEDKKTLKKELKEELYYDQYDDDLVIKVKEAANGKHAVQILGDFIAKNWDEDTLVYIFEPGDNVFEQLEKELMNKDGHIYLTDYYNLFLDGHDIDKDIYTIMKEQGLKTENLIKDSQISLAYFLSVLIEKILSK